MSVAASNNPQGWKTGNIKRHLDTVTVCNLMLVPDSSFTGTQVFRLQLDGLTGCLRTMISGVFISAFPEAPILPSSIPAGAATIQLTPRTNHRDAGSPGWLRPVFQDPAMPQNENHPLAQDLPFGWTFDDEADSVIIDITVDADLLAGLGLVGFIACQVTTEYVGSWWDPKTIELALGQVRLKPAGEPPNVQTGGG